MAAIIPNTAMAVTADLGDSLNVHPIRKREVGERFALQAFKKAYGKNNDPDGPSPVIATINNDTVVITFCHAQGLKTSDAKQLQELEAAGSDGIFHPVTAEIRDDRILFKTGHQPIARIHYGWKPFSRGNLVNGADLPASTFEIEIH
jgi:sialate O-acetylesterase